MHVKRVEPEFTGMADACSAPFWAVISTHPQAERLAVSELARAGYTAYLPLIAVSKRDPVVKTQFRVVRVPLFTGYAFVTIDGPWVPVRYTSGVRDLLMNGARPAVVPTGLVERLQAEDAQRCDLAAESLPALATGAAVVVSDGPMAGHAGAVVTCDGRRTQVQVALFGRLVPVWLDRHAVDIAA